MSNRKPVPSIQGSGPFVMKATSPRLWKRRDAGAPVYFGVSAASVDMTSTAVGLSSFSRPPDLFLFFRVSLLHSSSLFFFFFPHQLLFYFLGGKRERKKSAAFDCRFPFLFKKRRQKKEKLFINWWGISKSNETAKIRNGMEKTRYPYRLCVKRVGHKLTCVSIMAK